MPPDGAPGAPRAQLSARRESCAIAAPYSTDSSSAVRCSHSASSTWPRHSGAAYSGWQPSPVIVRIIVSIRRDARGSDAVRWRSRCDVSWLIIGRSTLLRSVVGQSGVLSPIVWQSARTNSGLPSSRGSTCSHAAATS